MVAGYYCATINTSIPEPTSTSVFSRKVHQSTCHFSFPSTGQEYHLVHLSVRERDTLNGAAAFVVRFLVCPSSAVANLATDFFHLLVLNSSSAKD